MKTRNYRQPSGGVSSRYAVVDRRVFTTSPGMHPIPGCAISIQSSHEAESPRKSSGVRTGIDYAYPNGIASPRIARVS